MNGYLLPETQLVQALVSAGGNQCQALALYSCSENVDSIHLASVVILARHLQSALNCNHLGGCNQMVREMQQESPQALALRRLLG